MLFRRERIWIETNLGYDGLDREDVEPIDLGEIHAGDPEVIFSQVYVWCIFTGFMLPL